MSSTAPVSETLIDVVTTIAQASIGGALVVLLGWAWYAASYGKEKEKERAIQTVRGVARNALLPALILVTLAASPTLTWKRVLQQWPAVVVALLAHVPSIVLGVLGTRYASGEKWLAESMSFNNASSYPLVIVQILRVLSSPDTGLGHLRWRTLDTLPRVTQRATEYAVLNLVIVELARMALCNLLPRILGHVVEADADLVGSEDEENTTRAVARSTDNGVPSSSSPNEADDDEAATERTPLVRSSLPPYDGARALSPNSTLRQRTVYFALHPSPIIVAAALGLLIGLIKPLQRALVGHDVLEGDYSGAWRVLGSALILLGGTFGAVDLFVEGAALKAAEAKRDEKTPAQPVLGAVLVLAIWRFFAVPLTVYAVVRGFRHIGSVHAYLQDPAFSFILVLSYATPPAYPAHLSPNRAEVHRWLHVLSLLASPALALAIAAAGHGVTFDTGFDLGAALRDATGDGVAGAMAMVLQVLLLMPMRTIMNFQYRYGGSIRGSAQSLYADGGFRRYYAGMGAALFQGPLSRFGDTAANAFILSLLATLTWPVLIKTIAASLGSAAFRMLLTPIDTIKTTQQTRGGAAGLKLLRERVRKEGVQCLWWGALAAAAATFVGHYPWFGTYNYLSEHLPPAHTALQQLARRAFIGFAASVASDTISNSLRVVKTYRQVHEKDVGYFTAAREIVRSEGIAALFGRGLPVRLMTNGLQGIIFSILWRRFADIIKGK